MFEEILDNQSSWIDEDNTTECRADVFLSNDFSHLEDVKQVYSFLLNKDMTKILLAIHKRDGGYTLPGGHVEKGETLIQTLIREIKEETNKDIYEDKILPFFYQRTYKKINEKWTTDEVQVRYIVVMKNDNKFISDPDNGDIVGNEWVNITELDKFLKWGNTTEMIKNKIGGYIEKLK